MDVKQIDTLSHELFRVMSTQIVVEPLTNSHSGISNADVLAAMSPAKAGDNFRVSIGGMGSCSVRFH